MRIGPDETHQVARSTKFHFKTNIYTWKIYNNSSWYMKTSKFSIKAIQIHVQIFIIMVSCMWIIIQHILIIVPQRDQACISHLKPMMIKAYYKTCEDLRDLNIENSHTFQVLTYR